jgi:thioesterase domain-containing protein
MIHVPKERGDAAAAQESLAKPVDKQQSPELLQQTRMNANIAHRFAPSDVPSAFVAPGNITAVMAAADAQGGGGVVAQRAAIHDPCCHVQMVQTPCQRTDALSSIKVKQCMCFALFTTTEIRVRGCQLW